MKTHDNPEPIDSRCVTCAGAGTLDPSHTEDCDPCSDCGGSGERNYLAEAFRIAAGNSSLACERSHLIAIVSHCRDLVSATFVLPEVA
jgi:hypothetical protein